MTARFNMKAIGLSLLCLAAGAIFLFGSGQAKAQYTPTIGYVPNLTGINQTYTQVVNGGLNLLFVNNQHAGTVDLWADTVDFSGTNAPFLVHFHGSAPSGAKSLTLNAYGYGQLFAAGTYWLSDGLGDLPVQLTLSSSIQGDCL